MRRIFVGLLFVWMLASGIPALSQSGESTRFMGGGVVERGSNAKMRGLIQELTVAYLTCESAYLETGKQTQWTIVAAGGDGVYSYQFRLFYRTRPLAENSDALFYLEASQSLSPVNTFLHTPERTEGQYLLEVTVTDSSGEYIRWQSPVYELASDEAGAVSKAKEIAEECLREAADSDYARALWLHDWLVLNADYDHTYTYYYADGVLLYGKGVCQSYAYAYEMMLKMIGIECVYITGTAGGGPHGWNLVKLGGEWYHVDVTWDDPGPGQESREYFCVTDEIMARDHAWADEPGVMPACDSEEYLYTAMGGACLADSEETFFAALDAMISAKQQYQEFLYTGGDEAFSLFASMEAYVSLMTEGSGVMGVSYSMNDVYGSVNLDYGSGYADIAKAQTVSVLEDEITLFEGDSCALTVFTLPLSASQDEIVFSSDAPGVAYAENGRVTAVSPGMSVITLSLPNGQTASISVLVKTEDVILLPAGITAISDEAFMNASSLQKIVLPDGVCEIGSSAFSGCAALCEIVIPESVSVISDTAFDGCGRLVIYLTENSYAHEYAEKHGISFEFITDSTLNSD